MTKNQTLVRYVPPGERRVTIAKQRVIVAVGPDDTGGKLRFYFEDEGLQPFHQQMNVTRWLKYQLAPEIQQKEEEMPDITADIIEFITAGDVDDDLEEIEKAVRFRMAFRSRTDNEGKEMPKTRSQWRVGDIVEIAEGCKPQYLVGKQFEIQKVNPKSVVIDIPNDPHLYRRYAGCKGVRLPKTLCKVIA